MGEESRGKYKRRPLEMLAALMDGAVLNRKTAAERFRMDPASAYRYLELIEEVVPGVERHLENRITHFKFDRDRLPEREPLDEGTTTFAEALGASFAAAFAKCFRGTGYDERLTDIRRKLISKLAMKKQRHFNDISRKIFVRSGHEEVLEDKHQLLSEVVESILLQQVIAINYRRFDGREEDCCVKPYTLAVYDGHLYVVGATESVPYYPFRFARILDLEVKAERFEYPAPSAYDPNVVFRDSIGIFVDPDPCDVRVRLDATWAVFAEHHRWHDSQQIETKLQDGSLILRMHVRPCKELERWILGMGEHALVLEPEDLRARISDRVRLAAEMYPTPKARGDSEGPSSADTKEPDGPRGRAKRR